MMEEKNIIWKPTYIGEVCNGKRKSYKGYFWKFKTEVATQEIV